MAFDFSDPNSTYTPDTGGGWGGFDPVTLRSSLAMLPQLQQAQRRAQQLRGAQDYFQQLQGQKGSGNYTPAVAGGGKAGLFPVVQQWQPDYKAVGNAITGALGNFYSNQQANTAENQANALSNPQIMKSLQQAGVSGMPGSAGIFGSGNLYGGGGY